MVIHVHVHVVFECRVRCVYRRRSWRGAPGGSNSAVEKFVFCLTGPYLDRTSLDVGRGGRDHRATSRRTPPCRKAGGSRLR